MKSSDKKIQLLHVCRSYPHHRLGGMENHAQDLINEAINHGYVVHVVTTPLPDEPALMPLETNGDVVEIGNKSAVYDYKFYRQLTAAITRICSEHPVELIHFQGFGGVIWEIGRRLKFHRTNKSIVSTHSIHGTLTSETPLYQKRFSQLSPLEKVKVLWRFKHRLAWAPIWYLFLKLQPNLIVDSKFTGRLLKRINPSLRPKRIPLGFYTAEFDSKVTKSNDDQQSQTALFIGRLEKIKNPLFLLQIWKSDTERQLPKLVIVGDGPEKPILESYLMKYRLEDRVELTGKVSNADRLENLKTASIFLNPDEGHPAFGLANAEALCFGIPVLTTPNGAHPEVVREEDGELSKVHPELWRSLILGILETKTKEKRLDRSERARKRFSRKQMGCRYDKYITMTTPNRR